MVELEYIQNIVKFVKHVVVGGGGGGGGGDVLLKCVCFGWENGWEVVVVIILQGTVPIPHTCKFSLLYRNNQSIFPLNLQQYPTSHKILITILLQLFYYNYPYNCTYILEKTSMLTRTTGKLLDY